MRSRLAARRRGLQRPTLSLWTCFRVPPRSSRWIGPMSPANLELRNSTSGFSPVHIPSLKGGSCHFSAICIERSPVPGSSHFPPALLTRRPLTSPTLWVLWSLPGGCPEGDGRRDRLDSWSREGATKSHWLGSESHQAHRTCRGALYGGFGGRRTPSVAQFDWDPWERKGVPDGRAHLTIWVIWGGC